MSQNETFKKSLFIEKNKINETLQRHSAQIYSLGLKVEAYKGKVETLKLELKIKTSKLSAMERRKVRNLPASKYPESYIKDMVNTNPEIIEIEEKLIKANKALGVAKVKLASTKLKGEDLHVLSNNVRAERKFSERKNLVK